MIFIHLQLFFTKLLPRQYRNLITKCLSNKPSERPTFKEILDNNYFDSINDSLNKGNLKIREFNKHHKNTLPLNIHNYAIMRRISESTFNKKSYRILVSPCPKPKAKGILAL